MAGRVVLIAICLLGAMFARPAAAQTSQEDVKATFIYRFASFVGWPPSAFTDATAPVRLCVMGADPLSRALERATAAQRLNGRAFDVRRLADPEDIGACHLLYVVGDRTAAALRLARQRSIVTITDSGADRGIIHFAIVDARVRFYIDDALAAESRLSVDPRLLNLALAVRRRPIS